MRLHPQPQDCIHVQFIPSPAFTKMFKHVTVKPDGDSFFGDYRNFKSYYQEHVRVHLYREFPRLVSYGRFVGLMQRAVVPLAVYLHHRFGRCSGISFVDSTALAVCRNQRIHQVYDVLTQARPMAGAMPSPVRQKWRHLAS
jgi:hypothetical protein